MSRWRSMSSRNTMTCFFMAQLLLPAVLRGDDPVALMLWQGADNVLVSLPPDGEVLDGAGDTDREDHHASNIPGLAIGEHQKGIESLRSPSSCGGGSLRLCCGACWPSRGRGGISSILNCPSTGAGMASSKSVYPSPRLFGRATPMRVNEVLLSP